MLVDVRTPISKRPPHRVKHLRNKHTHMLGQPTRGEITTICKRSLYTYVDMFQTVNLFVRKCVCKLNKAPCTHFTLNNKKQHIHANINMPLA